MAQRPSKKDLEKLYIEKGRDALVWYAWRKALRVLSVFGDLPIERIWGQDTVQHVVSVSRVCLILAQWARDPNQVKLASLVAAPSAQDSAVASIKSTSKVGTASAHAVAAVADAAAAAVASYVDAATAANSSAAADAAFAIITSASAFSFSIVKTSSAALDAAIADYQLLREQTAFTPEWWCSQPLWSSNEIGLGQSEPVQITQWRQVFSYGLRKLGLDFLAEDLNNLWDGRSLGVHTKNYLKTFSDAELNDPDALRRLILEGGNTTEYVHAVRVLLLGPGGAGKSSLADRLQAKPVEQQKRLTVGVDYLNHQPLDLYKTFSYLHRGEKPLDLYLWDFGGQTIFHGLHSAFLHENCVYVLVVDSRHEQSPDEWLHQIKHLAGRQAKVLLVTNWYEKCETRQNEVRLLREFPDLLGDNSFFYFSCHESDAPDFQAFVQALEKACLDSQRMVLKETLDVNIALQQQYQDDVFLDEDDLRRVIKEKARSEVKTVIDKLQQLGFMVKVDKDKQHYCLKPEWAVDHAYAVLYSSQLRASFGVMALDDLQDTFESEKKIQRKYMRHLVRFLHARSLCSELDNESTYFFPDAAPADELPEANRLLKEKETGLTIRFDLPYLPLGFHAALVHRLFVPGGISTPSDIWRQGFILRNNHSLAVAHYLTRKSVVELVLAGEWQDYAGLLNTVLVNLKAVLLEGKGIRDEQIVPSVLFDRNVFSVHSAEQLVQVLRNISNYDQIFEEVKRMAAKQVNETHYHGDVTHNTGGEGSNFATKSEHFTQNSHIQTIEVTADQRQQIATIVGSLLKDAGSLAPSDLLAVAKVNEALAAPEDKPEARNLLGKVWNGLKEVVDVTKTGTDIAGFVLEHQAAIAGAISTAVALLK